MLLMFALSSSGLCLWKASVVFLRISQEGQVKQRALHMSEVRGDEVIFGVSKHEHTVEWLGVDCSKSSPPFHGIVKRPDLSVREDECPPIGDVCTCRCSCPGRVV